MFNFPMLPVQASTFAERVDLLFWALVLFLFVYATGVTLVFLYFGLKYRQNPKVNRRSVHSENTALELTWTIIPVVVALGIFAWGAVLYYDYATVPENAIEISVIGKRWMWKMQHGNGIREVNTLHVPANQPVKLIMQSQDVIHSFYVPAFRVKQDVLPARYTTLWFEATLPGEYPLFCAEYCGTEHSTMGGTVVVMEPQDYQEWLAGGPTLTPANAGESLFQTLGCATCHAAGEKNRGPDLHGVYNREVHLRGGETLVADEEYIRESIMTPTARIVDGYAPLMPSYQNQLQQDQVASLLAYIKSLSKIGQ
ncbi:MAG: cytochrome c oxidase subunit II [Candidatus Hydrogenedentes bacterium]|nr:cytochrome c oxidase subunit II [Candidatus Hydrogenedentota bacterium]